MTKSHKSHPRLIFISFKCTFNAITMDLNQKYTTLCGLELSSILLHSAQICGKETEKDVLSIISPQKDIQTFF